MKTIMIVDDEDMILMLTEGILSSTYQTVRASSGEEAVELYGSSKPDLILSDILMPGMSGIEMYEEMKKRYGRNIPIIFMTASEEEEAELQTMTSGALDFIRKPLKADTLLKSIHTIFDRLEKMRQMF